ncbi:MAG: hypothetical protein II892_02495 [Fibrobacter sp.]|nr:hypothetical protein [Fibrobacter sp.]MBQ3776509.1 hypothetical protein [Fibrobacter sp.]
MKFSAILISFLFIFAANVLYGKQSNAFYSMTCSKATYEYRKLDFSKFFGDSLFENNGLFVFYEYLGVQRLYVMDYEHRENGLVVYQLPETQLLPWIHPEKYMEKRKQMMEKGIPIEKCRSRISSEERLVSDLDSLHIDSHLYVNPDPIKPLPENSYNRDKSHVIMGFSQNEGILRYFYYVKYDGFWENKGPRFSVYADVFKVMEQLNKKIAFPECK